MRWILVACAMAGCSGGKDEGTEFTPTLEFLSPTEGDTVPAGDLAVSIVVTDFILAPPETAQVAPMRLPFALFEATALAHNEEGTPTGYCELSLDGAVKLKMDSTQGTLVGVGVGPHTLTGELYFEDGDELEPGVEVELTFTAE